MGSLPDLPHGSSPDLALVHPTREEELIQFNLNAAEWRGALSQEAYLRRENHLSKQDQTKDGGISYWILIDKSAKHNPLDPTSSARLPLASCETYRKKALEVCNLLSLPYACCWQSLPWFGRWAIVVGSTAAGLLKSALTYL